MRKHLALLQEYGHRITDPIYSVGQDLAHLTVHAYSKAQILSMPFFSTGATINIKLFSPLNVKAGSDGMHTATVIVMVH